MKMKRLGVFSIMFLLITILLPACLNPPLFVYGQEVTKIEVNLPSVRGLDAQGNEVFYIELQKTGGISQIKYGGKTIASIAAGFIWMDDWDQTWGSTPTAEPKVEDKGSYVVITCQSRSNKHKVDMTTEIVITKVGLVFITLTMKAPPGGAVAIQTTGWVLKIATADFAGKNVAINWGDRIQRVSLPESFKSQDVTPSKKPPPIWVDMSFDECGVTLIYLGASTDLTFLIQDGRSWGENNFIMTYWHGDWGQGAMVEGTERTTKMALYIHGPGGYKSYESTLKIFSDIGSIKAEADKAYEKYTDARAKELVTEAKNKADSVFEKLLQGDIAGASAGLNESRNMLKQAQEAEETAKHIRELTWTLAPFIIIIVAYIVLVIVRRIRRKSKK